MSIDSIVVDSVEKCRLLLVNGMICIGKMDEINDYKPIWRQNVSEHVHAAYMKTKSRELYLNSRKYAIQGNYKLKCCEVRGIDM